MRMMTFLAAVAAFLTFSSYGQSSWDKPVYLKRCAVAIHANMFTATTFIEMEFCNVNDREVEGLYRFELKPNQVVTAFQLELNGKYRDGSIEEKWKATNSYNAIVGKRIDPALLTMDHPHQYSLRIFPFAPKGCRKVSLTIQELLSNEKSDLSYVLPIKAAEKVQKLNISISVKAVRQKISANGLLKENRFTCDGVIQKLEWQANDFSWAEPIAFSFPLAPAAAFCSKDSKNEKIFAIRFQPDAPRNSNLNAKTLTVYWDASASQQKRNIGREINFLQQFISYHNISQVTLIPFNQAVLDVAVFYRDKDVTNRLRRYLDRIAYDGATQLGIIDLSKFRSDLFLLFSDGVNTYGKARPATGNETISCIVSTPNANVPALQQIVGSGGGRVVNLYRATMSEAIAQCSKSESWLMNIESSSGKVAVGQQLPLRYEPVMFLNGMTSLKDDTLYLQFGNNKGIQHTQVITITHEGICTEKSLCRLAMLKSFQEVMATWSWTDMIDFGIREKLVTPHTAYIVLERLEDYVRYNITPPSDLKEACEKINYVKKDTRFERYRSVEMDRFDILNGVAAAYNNRIRDSSSGGKLITLDRQAYETNARVTSFEDAATGTSTMLTDKVAGLQSGNSALEEVVVVGYGTSMRKNLTAAVTVIRRPDVFSGATSVEQILQGRVAGLQVSNTSGLPGATANIVIRGISSLSNNQPLFVVDGVAVTGNINNFVGVNEIDNITVLKDNAASAIYGSRGANGVILITTKQGRSGSYYFPSQPYKLKDMEDVEYLQELKAAGLSEKVTVYQKLREEFGEEPGFYFDAAQHFFDIGQKQQAENILYNAAEKGDGSSELLHAMGFILESWGSYSKAISIYTNLIRADSLNLTYRSDLAWVQYLAGCYQQAVETLFNGIQLNMGQNNYAASKFKSMMLNDMNAIIGMHRDSLKLDAIPVALIRPLPVDVRVIVDCNKTSLSQVVIKEPKPNEESGKNANQGTKNAGRLNYIPCSNAHPVYEYQLGAVLAGRYKVMVNHFDYRSRANNIPSVVRLRIFKNFGKPNQTIEVKNFMLDNQTGEVEIEEILLQ